MNNITTEFTENMFLQAERNIYKLQQGKLDDILGIVGAPYDEQMKKRNETIFRTKENIVKKVHLGKRGNPIAISTTEKGGEFYHFTKLDGKPIFSKTYEGLINKLYEYYGGDALMHKHTVEYYFNAYIENYESDLNTNHKTARNAKAEFARFVSPELAKMDVRDVTAQYLEQYCKQLIVNDRLIISAFKNFKTLLNHIFWQAIKCGIIHTNPAKEVNNRECYVLCDQTVYSSLDYEDALISDEELERVFDEAKRKYDYCSVYGEKFFYCYDLMLGLHNELGCRPGELTALKWTDIKKGTLHIHGQVDSTRQYRVSTKNEKGISRGGRYFPLTPKALEILTELKARHERCGIVSEFLFCQASGKYILPEYYERYIKSVFENAGVRGKASYTFRRTVNNRLEEAGFTPSERAFLLGHTPETNIKFYTNPRKNAVLKKFEDHFCSGLPLVYQKNGVF